MPRLRRYWTAENAETEKMKRPRYENDDVLEKIKNRIHSARDRKILCDSLINGLTYERIAEKYDLSVSQIKRIVHRGEDAVFFDN